MNVLKIIAGVVLLAVLVAVAQLADPPLNSPAAQYRRLPDVNLTSLAEAEWVAARPATAVLVLDHILTGNQPDKTAAADLRQKIVGQLAADASPAARVAAMGATLTGNDGFESLARASVADVALYGEIAELARQGTLDATPDDFVTGLNGVRSLAGVFPPAEGALTLAKAARRTGALNVALTKQLQLMLGLMQADPKSALAVEKFRENFMPLAELAKRCRSWGEFSAILRQADSPDQLKVLTKMAASTPAAAQRLGLVLTVAARDGRPSVAASLDHLLRQGPKGLDALYDGLGKGAAGLRFVTEHPAFVPPATTARATGWRAWTEQYQALRFQYGGVVPALKYLALAFLAGLLVLLVVPGRYLEKLIARPGGPVAEPGAVHHFLSALAVGIVLSGLAFLLSLAVRPLAEPAATAAAVAGEGAAVVAGERGDSAFLSGAVVLISLAIHALVWFYVRGKIRDVEDDETGPVGLRLKQLDNLDVFLDLPLFTGLALTVIAFILITLDAGMSRHFAYTSTVVGILSSVSLRIRYQYPLKERLLRLITPRVL